MGFFQFGRKFDLVKEYSLEEIPLFSSLTPAEQKIIEKKARLLEYKRGDIIYREGTEPDAFYVVISGRLRAFTAAKGGNQETTLIFFYRGDHCGETSLLTGQVHMATVQAKSDGLILKLDKDEFLKLVQDIPAISLHLNRTLGHRLTQSVGAGSERREVKVAAFFAMNETDQSRRFWPDFAGALKRVDERKAILIDFHANAITFPSGAFPEKPPYEFNIRKQDPSNADEVMNSIAEHADKFHYLRVVVEEQDEATERKISALITFLTYRFDFLLIRLPRNLTDIVFKTLKQSDMVYLHSSPEPAQLARSGQVIDEFVQSYGFSKNEIKLVIPETKEKTGTSFQEQESILGHRIFSLLPDAELVPDRYQEAMSYLAKELSGTLVGLALGSGAAYGLAHVGVLKVLEEEKIPIDVIAGSSMGALIGSIWAAGHTAGDIERMACSITKRSGFFDIVGFRDISLAHWGFFKGNQVMRFLETYLGNKTFQDLRVPLRVTACNIFTAEEVIFRTGSVVQAVRASISIPGIFRPYLSKGQQLIDGGVIDPLPVSVLSKMGVKKIIAVNVLPSPENWQQRFQVQQQETQKRIQMLKQSGFWKKNFGLWIEKLKTKYSVNVFNVIMNTIQFMEYELAHTWGNEADVVLHPIVREAHWAEFYNAQKFIKAGIDRTREQLPEIKGILAEEIVR